MRRFHVLLLIIIAGLLGYWVGVNKITYDWKNFHPHLTVVNKEPPPSESTVDFSLFWTVLDKIQTMYYDKTVIDPQKLLNGAITGMVGSLGDPYTVYLPPVQNTGFKQSLAGQFFGIGAELGMRDKQIVVISPLDGMPAQKAGLKAGDAIVKVDGASTDGWTLQQAVDKIRGPKGTTVTLTVQRKDESSTKNVVITRDTITVKSVAGWVKKVKDIDGIKQDTFKGIQDESVAYIRLSQFGDNSNQEWLALVNSLYPQIKSMNAKGVILDLRNNPGGYLTDATFIASEFLDSGTVVIEDKGDGNQTPFPTVRKGLLTNTKVVVLINKGSASASEIVSGALRDHQRATLVGETSFGKGTIQEADDLGNGAGIHITIAKWLTPNGTWVHGKGLTPDVAVSLDPKDQSHDTQLEKAVEELVR